MRPHPGHPLVQLGLSQARVGEAVWGTVREPSTVWGREGRGREEEPEGLLSPSLLITHFFDYPEK